jgi:DNA modification methylase
MIRGGFTVPESVPFGLEELVPSELLGQRMSQSDIPRIAKNPRLTQAIGAVLHRIPSRHRLFQGDAREFSLLEPESVHLVLTSPPYWTLKKYRDTAGQMGHIADYSRFLDELDRVWHRCFKALVPGGRLICVVGDVCLSRKKNNGRHTVVPLHASIQERCRMIGFDNLAPIIWHKIANAAYEVDRGAGILGKPYEPNCIVKNDIEFILMQRKPGGYRKPAELTRIMSVIPESAHREWFQQIWSGITGASTRHHPAPYPEEIAQRLIRMFSFVGDTVFDPFAGTGTTSVAAAATGRNSIAVELDPAYFLYLKNRLRQETRQLFSQSRIDVIHK